MYTYMAIIIQKERKGLYDGSCSFFFFTERMFVERKVLYQKSSVAFLEEGKTTSKQTAGKETTKGKGAFLLNGNSYTFNPSI